MLLDVKNSCVVLVDVQEKLTPHVLNHQQLVANCKWILQVAKQLQVPILISEQYPQGLGHTVAELLKVVPHLPVLEKLHFSCAGDEQCFKTIHDLQRNQVVLIGIEAHVCVMQTAIELQEKGKHVYIVANAVSSRHEQDMLMGLQRMRDEGIRIVTKEMVLFEWLRQAGTDQFRQMSKEFLRGK